MRSCSRSSACLSVGIRSQKKSEGGERMLEEGKDFDACVLGGPSSWDWRRETVNGDCCAKHDRERPSHPTGVSRFNLKSQGLPRLLRVLLSREGQRTDP